MSCRVIYASIRCEPLGIARVPNLRTHILDMAVCENFGKAVEQLTLLLGTDKEAPASQRMSNPDRTRRPARDQLLRPGRIRNEFDGICTLDAGIEQNLEEGDGQSGKFYIHPAAYRWLRWQAGSKRFVATPSLADEVIHPVCVKRPCSDLLRSRSRPMSACRAAYLMMGRSVEKEHVAPL